MKCHKDFEHLHLIFKFGIEQTKLEPPLVYAAPSGRFIKYGITIFKQLT